MFVLWVLLLVLLTCAVLFWIAFEFQNQIVNSLATDDSLLVAGVQLGDYSAVMGNFATVFASLGLICTLVLFRWNKCGQWQMKMCEL